MDLIIYIKSIEILFLFFVISISEHGCVQTYAHSRQFRIWNPGEKMYRKKKTPEPVLFGLDITTCIVEITLSF